MKLKVRVIPNAKKQKIEKQKDQLKVHLTSQPIRGKANKELIDALSKHFKTKKSKITITKGSTSSQKEVEILN